MRLTLGSLSRAWAMSMALIWPQLGLDRKKASLFNICSSVVKEVGLIASPSPTVERRLLIYLVLPARWIGYKMPYTV